MFYTWWYQAVTNVRHVYSRRPPFQRWDRCNVGFAALVYWCDVRWIQIVLWDFRDIRLFASHITWYSYEIVHKANNVNQPHPMTILVLSRRGGKRVQCACADLVNAAYVIVINNVSDPSVRPENATPPEPQDCIRRMLNWPLTRYVKFWVLHAPGIPGTCFPATDFNETAS